MPTSLNEHIVSSYEDELTNMQKAISEMGGMVEQAITDAATALLRLDHKAAQDVRLFDKKVDESFLKTVAVTGDSTYDRGTNLQSLIIKYGDPKEKGFGEPFQLVPLSLTHFITKNVQLTAELNGYNEVVPKDGSRLLVTSDAGNPAVTVWNYFNGRVATSPCSPHARQRCSMPPCRHCLASRAVRA